MEPAYWQMRRLAQNLPSPTPESEFATLELSTPHSPGPEVRQDPDTPIHVEQGDTPLLDPECGRVTTRGGWRTLRPPAIA
jgi:hypothetical protein